MNKKINIEKLKIKLKPHFIVSFFLIALVTPFLYLTFDHNNNGGFVREEKFQVEKHAAILENRDFRETSEVSRDEVAATNETVVSKCDLFSGKWIYDDVSRPLYEEERCSFLGDFYACKKYGRKDFEYQKWRWQPHHCDLPRFNGTALLEKIRGKRVVFVGDSLNKNQWNSMLCLIESSLDPSTNKFIVKSDNLFVFKAIEYNATIEFYWSPLLVESNADDPYTHSTRRRRVRITSIEKHARHWNDADILIFDAFMWWLERTMTIVWGSFESPDAVYKRVEMRLRRYEIALTTWSDWLEFNINRSKTKLFFMSLSPYHFYYDQTLEERHNCYNETQPTSKGDHWGISMDREMMHVAESVLHTLGTRGLNITYLNITKLSNYRKDAHPSIYRIFQNPISEEKRANPRSYADCVHWCLPGVPDVWNEILYSYIMNS